MSFLILFVYIFVAFAITEQFVFFNGPFDVYDKLRKATDEISPKLTELFSCMACLSTWIGILLSVINLLFIPVPITPFNMILGTTDMWWFIIPLDAAFTCGTTWLLYRLEEMMDRVGITSNNEENE